MPELSSAAAGDEDLRPFRIDVPDAELDELRGRLSHTRWSPEPAGGLEGYGVPRKVVADLVDRWITGYDWRAWEARLNEHSQFTTTIDGAAIHFAHVRSPEPHALPLVLTHGWPGSTAEFLDVLGPLSDPRAFDLDPSIAFDLIVPGLPNSGWAGPTGQGGWGPRRIARAWAVLMARLGYQHYGAVGNDWGSVISLELGRAAPTAVVGVHVTQLMSLPEGETLSFPPTPDSLDVSQFSPADHQALGGLRFFQQHLGAYHHVHTQQPQTLGYALADSPVGLLAWASQVMGGLDPDVLLTHVTTLWLSGTAASAIRIYADHDREGPASHPTTVPVAVAQFPNDARTIHAFAARDHTNIVAIHTFDRGGHYAASQAPDLLVGDIREFFARPAAQGRR